jgi:hypothetical protein
VVDEVRIPDIEILINVAGSNMALVCFYKGKTIHDDFEIVAGIPSVTDIPPLVTVLEQAIKALHSGGWQSVDELDTRSVEEKNDPPF